MLSLNCGSAREPRVIRGQIDMSTVRGVRALRGATTVAEDTPDEVVEATTELLRAMLSRNGAGPPDLISVVFTATPDVTSAFPAAAARALGISDVPLLCAAEIPVPGALGRCIRVLIHLYTERAPDELEHVYLRAARSLRSDLA